MSRVLDSGLLEKLTDVAFRAALRVLNDRDAALDVAQDVVVNIHDGTTTHENPLAYAVRAACNRALNKRRNLQRRREIIDLHQPDQSAETPSYRVEQSEQQVILGAALESLADRQRESLLLRFHSELKIPEIAALMGISEGAVKTHLVRGLINLKEKLVSMKGEL
jgi:RNA polymerase sigma-70 factor (ECF subfamily)